MRCGKRKGATFIESQEAGKENVAQDITLYTHMLYDPREELLEEPKEGGTNKRTKCYMANLMIGGILRTALIDTGAEVTCLSEEFLNKNIERFRECPMLPINGVTLKGPMGGKAVRQNKQIYVDLQLPNCLIQTIFLVVPKLSRPCIIGIDLLDHLRSKIDLDSKTISFPYLQGEPSLRIMNEETDDSSENIMQEINLLTRDEPSADIEYEEIHKKLEEASIIEPEKREKIKKSYGNIKEYFGKDQEDERHISTF